ncbi:MAG: LptF/LptG family permease [Myxococcota bacterium]
MSWLASKALIRDALPPLALTIAALVGVGGLLLTVQALSLAAALPGLRGGLLVLAGFLPAALAVALPVGVLAGLCAAGRAWVEDGTADALAASGMPARALLPGVLFIGISAAAAEAALTHFAEPAGRGLARTALISSLRALTLRPGQPLVLGQTLLHAEGVQEGRYQALFIARDDLVLSAAQGGVRDDGVLVLTQGSAADLGEDAWSMQFASAELALPIPTPRLELVERSNASLSDLIHRTEAEKRAADFERLILYKRTAIPSSVPLLALLALPLGMRGVRPAAAALGVTLGWWTLTRLCDQLVGDIGPMWAAVTPAAALLLVSLWAWLTWSRR